MKTIVASLALAASALCLAPAVPAGDKAPPLTIRPLAEKRVAGLPPGDLYWRVEIFPTLAEAKAAAGTHALAAESRGKAWLFTLGPAGGQSIGTKAVELGPIPRVSATEYLLRINEATGAPGSVTSVHSHPGSEAFYVLAGEQSIRSPRGVMKVRPGRAEAGQGADVAMEVSSSGDSDLHSLVMFVVDASRPFSSPANLPGHGH